MKLIRIILIVFIIAIMMSIPISTEARTKYVPIITNTFLLNIREHPSKEAAVLIVVSKDERLEYISGADTEWLKVKTFDGVEGYVQSFFIELKEEYWFNTISSNSSLINYGKQFIGTPYVWGGNSLTKGIDCSAFTKQVFASEGIGLPRTAMLQSRVGIRIERDDLAEGDLIFFSDIFSEKLITHVGIYIGNSEFIHSGSSNGIEINTLERPWYSEHFMFGRRILK